MDKIKLNDQQLREVVAFIDRRGFHDPGVIVDILDHFACKVEEKMTGHPGLSLADAMAAAHADFGLLGFYPLLANYEVSTRRKYTMIYRTERNRALSDPFCFIPALLASFAVYKGFSWAQLHASFFGFNIASIVLFVSFLAVTVYTSIRFSIVRKKIKIYEAIHTGEVALSVLIVAICSQSGPSSPRQLAFFSAATAVAYFLVFIRSVVLIRVLHRGQSEFDMVSSYLRQNRLMDY